LSQQIYTWYRDDEEEEEDEEELDEDDGAIAALTGNLTDRKKESVKQNSKLKTNLVACKVAGLPRVARTAWHDRTLDTFELLMQKKNVPHSFF
jgi:hypothetical protein